MSDIERAPVARPLAEAGTRPQEHGRIRFGVKTANAMKAIDTWRFTSTDRDAIVQLAQLYGGTATAWEDPKANPPKQWQVITEASSIRVMLPPGGLSIWYELWSAAGCQRRCDGVLCEALTSDPNEPRKEVPCQCSTEGHMKCKPKTRLNVLLPEIRMAGFWRMETGSWNAAEELPAMEHALSVMQTYGVLEARLTLHKQSDIKNGKRRHFIVPRLEFNETTEALLRGAASATGTLPEVRVPGVMGAERHSPALALGSGGEDWVEATLAKPVAAGNEEGEEGIIDAVVVEESSPPPPRRDPAKAPLRARMHATIGEVAKAHDVNPDELRHGMVRAITQGASQSSTDLTDADVSRVIDYLEQVLAGERTVQIHDGEVRLPTKES